MAAGFTDVYRMLMGWLGTRPPPTKIRLCGELVIDRPVAEIRSPRLLADFVILRTQASFATPDCEENA